MHLLQINHHMKTGTVKFKKPQKQTHSLGKHCSQMSTNTKVLRNTIYYCIGFENKLLACLAYSENQHHLSQASGRSLFFLKKNLRNLRRASNKKQGRFVTHPATTAQRTVILLRKMNNLASKHKRGKIQKMKKF